MYLFKPEHVSCNPFLSAFYADMQRIVFRLEVYMNLSMIEDIESGYKEAYENGKVLLSDWGISSVYAFIMAKRGIMNADTYSLFKRTSKRLSRGMPQPDIMFYLRLNLDSVLERIRSRNRECERGLLSEGDTYVSELISAYDDWFRGCRGPKEELDGEKDIDELYKDVCNASSSTDIRFIWITGPLGAGKTTLCYKLMERSP